MGCQMGQKAMHNLAIIFLNYTLMLFINRRSYVYMGGHLRSKIKIDALIVQHLRLY